VGPIDADAVQAILDQFANQDVFLHLETTPGAYAATRNENVIPVGAFIRNGRVRYARGSIHGGGPYRVGLKLDLGWVYAEGLTDWELDAQGRLLLAGHDREGRLGVALELSRTPFGTRGDA
jgi:hypothetical protein